MARTITTLKMVMIKDETLLQTLSLGLAALQCAAQSRLPMSPRKINRMMKKALYSILLIGLSFSGSRVWADDAALINALVRKGILNQKDAEAIEAEVNKEGAEASQQNPN